MGATAKASVALRVSMISSRVPREANKQVVLIPLVTSSKSLRKCLAAVRDSQGAHLAGSEHKSRDRTLL